MRLRVKGNFKGKEGLTATSNKAFNCRNLKTEGHYVGNCCWPGPPTHTSFKCNNPIHKIVSYTNSKKLIEHQLVF